METFREWMYGFRMVLGNWCRCEKELSVNHLDCSCIPVGLNFRRMVLPMKPAFHLEKVLPTGLWFYARH